MMQYEQKTKRKEHYAVGGGGWLKRTMKTDKIIRNKTTGCFSKIKRLFNTKKQNFILSKNQLFYPSLYFLLPKKTKS